jgi:hypothetical protein
VEWYGYNQIDTIKEAAFGELGCHKIAELLAQEVL